MRQTTMIFYRLDIMALTVIAVLVAIDCFLLGYAVKQRQTIHKLVKFFTEDNYDSEKNSEKENKEIHEYGEIPKSCPGGWKNCPGTDSDGKVFPDHYADADSRA